MKQSFVDCFAGYHQIKMHKDDAENVAFVTPWSVYSYKVISIGLKNVEATYMKENITLFHSMIYEKMRSIWMTPSSNQRIDQII